jgi:hypothetical protein
MSSKTPDFGFFFEDREARLFGAEKIWLIGKCYIHDILKSMSKVLSDWEYIELGG